jgi:hypothetical protein
VQFRCFRWCGIAATLWAASCEIRGALRQEFFDATPTHWEGVNNRNEHFPVRTVIQDFGYSPVGKHFANVEGEIGGKINPAGEAAYYGYRLPRTLSLNDPISASGKLLVPAGHGHFLFGFFNYQTLNEWRTPNTIVARINPRGEGFHCHLEYCSGRWRCEAGVIGEIVRGERITPKMVPCGQVLDWKLTYDPKGADGKGLATLKLGNDTATCALVKEHRADGATFTHFGLLPVLKAWDDPGEVWLGDLTIADNHIDLRKDPGWDAANNRRTYQSKNTRPKFDFGWSPTHFAGGRAPGELGGLIFRGDCREKHRLAAFGDKLSTLTLKSKLYARGKVSMVRGVSDSTASIGFYNSISSLTPNPAQDQATPKDYLGINIEGPSSEGFYFYPVYRTHETVAGAFSGGPNQAALRIFPDGKVHSWALAFDPAGANGNGKITVTLDEQTCSLELEPRAKEVGASFDRFGICTPWIDGNSVTAYFDDLEYTVD